MKNKLMFGLWRYILNIPPFLWEQQISKAKKKFSIEHAFMTPEHRVVHHFVVKQLPIAGKSLSPETVSEELNMPLDRANLILNELEKRMTFLFRNSQGNVIWAYPVTVEKTPHRIAFSTGERLYAA